MEWSEYQKTIFNAVGDTKDNLIIEALAGSGKTSTILEALNYIDPRETTILLAFNKKIADEMTYKAPHHVKVNTMHALGFRILGKKFKGIQVNQDKMEAIYKKAIGDAKENRELIYLLCRAISCAKNTLSQTYDEIDETLDFFDIEPPDGVEREYFINHILMGLEICQLQTNIIDFDDMIYLPAILDIPLEKYDNIIIDEVQDLNSAQIEFIFKLLAPTKKKQASRCIIVGDQNQQLYAFRGADLQVLTKFKTRLNGKSLSLPICYRCPVKVLKEAQKIVPTIEPRPHAPEGFVQHSDYSEMYKKVKPGDFIVSRSNAPLVKIAMTLIKKRMPCKILGKDIGDNLLNFLNKTKTIEKLKNRIEKWKTKETMRLLEKGKDASQIADKAECLFALMEGCTEISQVRDNIKNLFDNVADNKKIILSTVHQCKGLESPVVWMIYSTFNEGNQSEKNIKYTAITRSMQELYFVMGKK